MSYISLFLAPFIRLDPVAPNLAVPEKCGEDHLKLLAQVAELFSDPELLEELRAADSSGKMLKLLSRSRH